MDPSALVWLLVVVIVIQGAWMAGLTYLLWRDHWRKTKRAPEADAPKAP